MMASNRAGRVALAAVFAATLVVAIAAFRSAARSELDPVQASASAFQPALVAHPTWAFDPNLPGEDVPPAGRSLFDFLLFQSRVDKPAVPAVPFPFSALLQRLGDQLQPDEQGPGYKAVLIPLGRSLQRTAAAPDFFAYPRVVVASVGSPASSSRMLLKDRLYLGFQEKAATIEVISYNEAVGRFEFQQVKDYRPGGTPRVYYSSRALCTSCHQNGGPIFSRQVWDETNGNPRVAALLEQHSNSFFGIPVDRGIDIPNAIDNAKLRANRFAATQMLWREGCGGNEREALACRARLFRAALQYKLSGEQQFERAGLFEHDAASRIRTTWQRRWPGGLAIGNPDIPNRDPLAAASELGGRGVYSTVDSPSLVSAISTSLHGALVNSIVHIPAEFEPLALREPLEIWAPPLAGGDDRVVAGLAEFIPDADAAAIDRQLKNLAPASRKRFSASCRTAEKVIAHDRSRVEFSCGRDAGASEKTGAGGQNNVSNDVSISGQIEIEAGRVSAGVVDSLTLPGQTPSPAPLRRIKLVPAGITARAGERRASLQLVRDEASEPRRERSRASESRVARQAAAKNEIRSGTLSPGPSPARGEGGPLRARGVRGGNGDTIAEIELSWRTGSPDGSRAEITVLDDFSRVEAAIAAMLADAGEGRFGGRFDGFDALPFRRARLMPALYERLGLPATDWCCLDTTGMAPIRMDPPRALGAEKSGSSASPSAANATPTTRVFFDYCATCHDTPDRAPAHFLRGSEGQVASNLNRCAERIYVRLAMWNVDRERRAKTPMPPESALRGMGTDAESWRKSGELIAATAYARDLVKAHSGRVPDLDALLANGYESLPACTAAGG